MNEDYDIMKRLRYIRNLPTLPSIYKEVQGLLRSSDVPLEQVAKFLEKDQSLTLKVLRLVNSAFYGFPGRIKTVEHAVVILGLDTLHGLLMAASIIQSLKGRGGPVDPARFWTHSFGCATISKRIASLIGADEGEYFTAGLIHDVGKVILCGYFGEEFLKVEEYRTEHDVPGIEAESEVLGHTHEEIGGFIIKRWALPQVLYRSVANHHKPSLNSEESKVGAAVHVANVLAYQQGFGNNDVPPELDDDALEFLNLTEKYPDQIIGDVEEIKEELKFVSDYI